MLNTNSLNFAQLMWVAVYFAAFAELQEEGVDAEEATRRAAERAHSEQPLTPTEREGVRTFFRAANTTE